MAEGRGSSPRGPGPRATRVRTDRRTPADRPGVRPGQPGGRSDRGAGTVAAPRPRLTGRAAVLVLVVAALMVSYASSLRAYLEQRHHIAQLQDSIASSQKEISSLQREKERWADDAYVISQARARFAFGFPGEIGYQVLGTDGQPLDHQDSLSSPQKRDDGPEWWQSTLTSITTAGNPPAPAPTPATRITPPADSSRG